MDHVLPITSLPSSLDRYKEETRSVSTHGNRLIRPFQVDVVSLLRGDYEGRTE